jgi:Ser-tRNA(Ala) deacylase AlaX
LVGQSVRYFSADCATRAEIICDGGAHPGLPEVTKRLYWIDPYRKEFDATIVGLVGNELVLNQTCFYPRGGGQTSDTGVIDSTHVTEVLAEEDGTIAHILDKPIPSRIGDLVHGKIDWEKRYRTMRLHSASHILYYVVQEVFGGDVKPASSGLVDEKKDRTDYLFDAPLDQDKLKEAEQRVNAIVREGREIRTWNEPTEGEKRMWKLDPYPVMMCGGTHVKNTGEIGEVVVSRGKKPGRGKERIEIILTR